MKQNTYESNQVIIVFKKLGFEIFKTSVNEIIYFYHKDIQDEVFVDKIPLISNRVIQKQLENIGLTEWAFDSLYEQL